MRGSCGSAPAPSSSLEGRCAEIVGGGWHWEGRGARPEHYNFFDVAGDHDVSHVFVVTLQIPAKELLQMTNLLCRDLGAAASLQVREKFENSSFTFFALSAVSAIL